MEKVSLKITDHVRELLKKTSISGVTLRLIGQFSRKDYVAVNKVLEALGGKWSREENSHIFTSNPREAIDNIINGGSLVDKKKTFELFETPQEVIEKMLELANIKDTDRVLEPSAGKGKIAWEILNYSKKLDVCEMQADLFVALKADGFKIVGADFLVYTGKKYDKIIANPPFSNGKDIDHVMQMWKLLRKGGRIVSVMAKSFVFREQKKWKTFREFVETHGYWIELDEGSFKESGTMVNSVIVVLEKAAAAPKRKTKKARRSLSAFRRGTVS